MLKNCKKARQNGMLLHNCNGNKGEFRSDILINKYLKNDNNKKWKKL